MENSTENPKYTDKLGDVSHDETLTVQGGEADISSESTAGQDGVGRVAIAELEDAEVLGVIEQAICEEPREAEPAVIPCCTETLEVINEIKSDLTQVSNGVNGITETTSKIANEIREIHKLYHNEFANRLQSMQEELKHYREIEKGRTFDGILGEIAKVYSDNITVLNEISDEKINKRLRYMFLDLLQLLGSYGVSKQESKEGDKRNPNLHPSTVCTLGRQA